MNCVYCGYAVGVLQYWVKIFGETEKYWCGIKHENNANFKQPEHQSQFTEYNDKEQYKKTYL